MDGLFRQIVGWVDRPDLFTAAMNPRPVGVSIDTFSFPVTLTVGGGLVSGILVAQAEYLQWLSASFADAARRAVAALPRHGHSPAESTHDAASRLLTQVFGGNAPVLDGEDDDPPDEPTVEPVYLHIKDAQLAFGGNPVIKAAYWRVELDAVTGWAPGLTDLGPPQPHFRR
jgi:hypothetical protein